MTLVVMGCVVNGPGESKAASIGISLPGTGEEPHCPVYIDGQHFTTLKGTYEELAVAFRALVDDYIATKYRVAKCCGAAAGVERTKVLEQTRFFAPFQFSYGLKKVDINEQNWTSVTEVNLRL